jgi:hypothetical protein
MRNVVSAVAATKMQLGISQPAQDTSSLTI